MTKRKKSSSHDLSKEDFQQILDAISDMILVKGPKSKLLWANRAFRTCYGMSNEQLRGIIDAPFVEPDYTQNYVRDDAKVFQSGETLEIPQEPITTHEGKTRIAHTTKSPIFDKNNNVIMTVGISRDITDVLAAQKSLEEEKSRTFYSAKMASLGEMAGGIAHEINSPLAVIQMLSSQLVELIEENEIDKKHFAESLKKIETTTIRIAKIVSGLRTFSREGSEDGFAQMELGEMVHDTLSFCTDRFAHKGVQLFLEMPPQKIFINANAAQLSQVLLNLLNNAYDATSTLNEKWVRVELLPFEDRIELCVTDSGSGISEAVREKMFTPFFTTKEIGKGTGLGLSISKNIIESHEGSFTLDTTSKNTRFVVSLPIRSERKTA